MNKLRLSLLYFLILFASANSKAEVQPDTLDKIVVSDLTENWLYYDQQFKTFFPYLKDKGRVNSVSQLLELNKYKSYNLNFIASPGLSLFVDQKLFYKNTTDEEVSVKIKIQDLVASHSLEKELISFYHPKGNLPLNNFYIGHTFIDNPAIGTINKVALELSRQLNSRQNIFVITFLLILSIFAIIRNRYPKKFYELAHFNIIPSLDEDVIWDLSSVPVLLFVIINSLCSALILFVIFEQFNLNTLYFLNIFYNNAVLGILVVSAGFFLVFLMKYLYLKILGWIFNLSDLVKIQFFELMKVSLKINLFLTVLTMIFYCSSYFHVRLNFDYFFYFTIISLFIVLIRVAYLSFKLSGFRNIYLFSYLCTTEILPLVIIVKMILF